MAAKKYILVVELLTTSILRAVDELNKDRELELVVLTRNIDFTNRIIKRYSPSIRVHVLLCNFDSELEIKNILKPFKDSIAGVACRSDKRIQDMRKLVPLLPGYVKAPTYEALTAATNKRLMREYFLKNAPEITPQFVKVSSAGKESLEKISRKLKYPVIVKPANLASSLLIAACQTPAEAEAALNKIFALINDIYLKEERGDQPEVIVEEYMEGDFYSVDAYILKSDEIYFCPPVFYVPAKQLGIDDFFLYKRSIPTKLSKAEIRAANETVRKAINAIGLEYSSAHVELVLTKNGWKIIELGPRLGRFRTKMYKLSYDIDHSLNDLKARLNIKPAVNEELIEYCSAYSIYPHREGQLIEIRGLGELVPRSELKWHKVSSAPGQQVVFAKHGGHALAEFIISSPGQAELDKLSSYIEKEIYADINTSGN